MLLTSVAFGCDLPPVAQGFKETLLRSVAKLNGQSRISLHGPMRPHIPRRFTR
jgi:hypothetical protein